MKQQEKNQLYQQMNQILAEVQRLMAVYESLKDYLISEKAMKTTEKFTKKTEQPSIYQTEIENQQYLSERKRGRPGYDYQTLALTIASLLKEQGRPMSTKEIHESLAEKGYMLTRTNLSSNILRRIQMDSKIHVERAYRGYWQYRFF